MTPDELRDRRNDVVEALYREAIDAALDPIRPLPVHRTEAGYPRCATCGGGGCFDCTDPA